MCHAGDALVTVARGATAQLGLPAPRIRLTTLVAGASFFALWNRSHSNACRTGDVSPVGQSSRATAAAFRRRICPRNRASTPPTITASISGWAKRRSRMSQSSGPTGTPRRSRTSKPTNSSSFARERESYAGRKCAAGESRSCDRTRVHPCQRAHNSRMSTRPPKSPARHRSPNARLKAPKRADAFAGPATSSATRTLRSHGGR